MTNETKGNNVQSCRQQRTGGISPITHHATRKGVLKARPPLFLNQSQELRDRNIISDMVLERGYSPEEKKVGGQRN